MSDYMPCGCPWQDYPCSCGPPTDINEFRARRSPEHEPDRSRQSLEFCERVARSARAEVERIEEVRHALMVADVIAAQIWDELNP